MTNTNINYKTTTFILLILLIINISWNVSGNLHNVENENCKIGSTHQMPNGETMSDDDMESIMMDMTANMVGKSGKELEKSFITEMIPHHQGAVDMAKLLLEDKNVNSELRDFANEIITAQEKEINQMQEWLKKY